MNGHQHFEAAERLLRQPGSREGLMEAQVHATLALAWATSRKNSTHLGDGVPIEGEPTGWVSS